MRKIILGVIPLLLAIVTIFLMKPSEEKCRQVAIDQLQKAFLFASDSNIIVKDYFLFRTIHYKIKSHTFKLGSAAFLQVRIKDERASDIKMQLISERIKEMLYTK